MREPKCCSCSQMRTTVLLRLGHKVGFDHVKRGIQNDIFRFKRHGLAPCFLLLGYSDEQAELFLAPQSYTSLPRKAAHYPRRRPTAYAFLGIYGADPSALFFTL